MLCSVKTAEDIDKVDQLNMTLFLWNKTKDMLSDDRQGISTKLTLDTAWSSRWRAMSCRRRRRLPVCTSSSSRRPASVIRGAPGQHRSIHHARPCVRTPVRTSVRPLVLRCGPVDPVVICPTVRRRRLLGTRQDILKNFRKGGFALVTW